MFGFFNRKECQPVDLSKYILRTEADQAMAQIAQRVRAEINDIHSRLDKIDERIDQIVGVLERHLDSTHLAVTATLATLRDKADEYNNANYVSIPKAKSEPIPMQETPRENSSSE
jgi:uncharacterized protein YaaN involved in tellurite resistance